MPPDEDAPWHTWLLLGGRGAGKTRAGAEWVSGLVGGLRGIAAQRVGRIALVGETIADVRDVMVDGPSGLLAVAPAAERPRWKPSLRAARMAERRGRARLLGRGPGEPARAAIRGRLGGRARQVALRARDLGHAAVRPAAGPRPRQVVTTTPRPIPLIKRLVARPGVVDDAGRAPPTTPGTSRRRSSRRSAARYGGTRLGRQELDGELIEDRPDALWKRDAIEAARVAAAPALMRIVVAVDPPASSGRRAGACGIVAAGIDAGGMGYVLADATVAGVAPEAWAAQAVALYRRLEADALVAEVNQGGDMVAAVLRDVDPAVPVTSVVATRGKYARAEPVAALYEQGRVRHVGAFPALEDEMCDFGPAGLSSGRSPDRLDALVWALTDLMLEPRAEPRLRAL